MDLISTDMVERAVERQLAIARAPVSLVGARA
jgi:hypothetical protein